MAAALATKAVLPCLALGSVGSAGISFAYSAYDQNNFAKQIFPDIPKTSKPYPNWFQRLRGNISTNHTYGGFLAFLITFGGVAFTTRLAMMPVSTLLRKQFIFIPGTTIPKRINGFFDLLYDICPDVVANTVPLTVAAPIAFRVKVWVDGPGRFTDWKMQWNPYETEYKIRYNMHHRPSLPIRPLHKVTADDIHVPQGLWEKPNRSLQDKISGIKQLNVNCENI